MIRLDIKAAFDPMVKVTTSPKKMVVIVNHLRPKTSLQEFVRALSCTQPSPLRRKLQQVNSRYYPTGSPLWSRYQEHIRQATVQ